MSEPTTLRFTIKVSELKVIPGWALAILLSLVVRFYPEALFPYPIGFDTPLYFAAGKTYASNGQFFPLLYFILGRLYALGVDMTLLMKFLPTVLYGLLGFSVYTFASRCLNLSKYESLVISGMVAISHAALRISWDMHKLLLASALLILAIALENSKNKRERVLYPVLMLLALASHELIAAIAITYIITKTTGQALLTVIKKRRPANLTIDLLLSIAAPVLFLIWYSLIGATERLYNWIYGLWIAPPFSNLSFEIHNLKFFIFIFGTLIPFTIIGVKKNHFILTWLIFTLIGSFSTIIVPSFMLGGVLPWRYVLLAFFPTSVTAGLGIIKIARRNRSRYNALIAASLVILVNINSLFFLGIMDSPSYMEAPEVMPRNMISSSIPIWDIKPVMILASYVKDEQAAVLTPGNFVGWVRYYSQANVYGFTKPYKSFNSLRDAINNLGEDEVYLIWWVDDRAKAMGFKELSKVGNLRLYKYMG